MKNSFRQLRKLASLRKCVISPFDFNCEKGGSVKNFLKHSPTIFKKEEIKMKNLFLILLFVFTIISCEKEIKGDLDLTHDTAQNGMVQGKVLAPMIENNTVVYKGIEGVNVEIVGTEFRTISLSGGTFAIDGIPTGGYEIHAYFNYPALEGYEGGENSVVIQRQQSSYVEIQLRLVDYRAFVYGVAYDSDGSVYANKPVSLYSESVIVGDLLTTPAGEFAFENYSGSVYLKSNGKNLVWIDPLGNYLYLGGGEICYRNAMVVE